MATPLKKKTVPKKKVVITKTGAKMSENWCRVEMKLKPATEFYQATDTYIDKSGLMSVCKGCLTEIYDRIYLSEGSIEKTILRMCRSLNVRYDERAIDSMRKQLATMKENGKVPSGVFGIYRQKLYAVQSSEIGKRNEEDLGYQDVGGIKIVIADSELETEEERITLEELKDFWGDGFALEDYKFLEKRIAEWKRDYSCSNKAEELVIKELCFKEMELTKSRIEGGKTSDSVIKAIDSLLKTGGLAPAQSTASTGKSYDTIGMMIKQIETTTPAEYYQDKELFKDFDGLEKYITNYIKRPIMNFIGASKSFEIVDDDVDTMGFEDNEEIEVEKEE